MVHTEFRLSDIPLPQSDIEMNSKRYIENYLANLTPEQQVQYDAPTWWYIQNIQCCRNCGHWDRDPLKEYSKCFCKVRNNRLTRWDFVCRQHDSKSQAYPLIEVFDIDYMDVVVERIANEHKERNLKKRVTVITFNGTDETEFDTWGEHKLAELWWEFCKENKLITIDKKERDKDAERGDKAEGGGSSPRYRYDRT